MYKTVFLDHDEYGCEIQEGNVKRLENLLNEWYDNGWELVSIASAPCMVLDPGYYNYVLILKKRSN